MTAHRRLGLLALVGVALASPACADPFTDAQTGISLDPPPGYQVSRKKWLIIPTRDLLVERLSKRDAECTISFEERARVGLTVQELNRRLAGPEYKEALRESLGRLFNVTSLETEEVSGLIGSIVVLEVNAWLTRLLPLIPKEILMMGIIVSPKGIATVTCAAAKGTFEDRKGEFEAIIRSVVAPR